MRRFVPEVWSGQIGTRNDTLFPIEPTPLSADREDAPKCAEFAAAAPGPIQIYGYRLCRGTARGTWTSRTKPSSPGSPSSSTDHSYGRCNLGVIIVARAVQGIGGALMTPRAWRSSSRPSSPATARAAQVGRPLQHFAGAHVEAGPHLPAENCASGAGRTGSTSGA